MPILDDIAEGIFKLFLHFVFELLFFYTGECVLYVLSFGSRKPRWDFYENERPLIFVIRTEISWWVGFFFWVFLVGWMIRSLLN